MGTLNFAGGASLSGSGSNLTSTSGVDFSGNLNFGGNWTDAPVGTTIKTGHWSTGYGTASGLITSSGSLADIGMTGTNANGFGITSNGAELTFNKISNKSHLLITIHFPTYVSNTGDLGCGLAAYAMHDGSNWVRIDSTASHGPWDYWGALGYGSNAAGTINYTFSTSTLASARSSFLAKTGDVKIKFQGRSHNTNTTIYFLTYGASNPKEGTIQVQEVIAE